MAKARRTSTSLGRVRARSSHASFSSAGASGRRLNRTTWRITGVTLVRVRRRWPGPSRTFSLGSPAMGTDALKSIWRDGGTALGAWLSLPEPLVAEAASLAGYDYVCIDMQHGLVDYAGAVNMLGAMARGPATPLVRVPWNEPGIIGRALDAGA